MQVAILVLVLAFIAFVTLAVDLGGSASGGSRAQRRAQTRGVHLHFARVAEPRHTPRTRAADAGFVDIVFGCELLVRGVGRGTV